MNYVYRFRYTVRFLLFEKKTDDEVEVEEAQYCCYAFFILSMYDPMVNGLNSWHIYMKRISYIFLLKTKQKLKILQANQRKSNNATTKNRMTATKNDMKFHTLHNRIWKAFTQLFQTKWNDIISLVSIVSLSHFHSSDSMRTEHTRCIYSTFHYVILKQHNLHVKFTLDVSFFGSFFFSCLCLNALHIAHVFDLACHNFRFSPTLLYLSVLCILTLFETMYIIRCKWSYNIFGSVLYTLVLFLVGFVGKSHSQHYYCFCCLCRRLLLHFRYYL